MGWEEDYRQSQILEQTRNMAESLKKIENAQWEQNMKNTYGSSGGGSTWLPSGKTMLKILAVMLVIGAVIFPGTIFIGIVLGLILSGVDALAGCTLVVDMPDYQVITTAISFLIGFIAFVLVARFVKKF